jgi:hypothetical protein
MFEGLHALMKAPKHTLHDQFNDTAIAGHHATS